MERALLEGMLAEGLSLEAIGSRVGRHPSTISYWLRKHGLEPVGRAKHAPRHAVDAAELERLVRAGHSVREMAALLGVSATTVRHHLQRLGLRSEKALTRGADKPKRILRTCRRHGRTEFVAERRQRYYRCVKCRAERVAARRRRVKQLLVQEAGGRCSLCGYDRFAGALQFHHLDPSAKTFGLSLRGITRSLERLREEARKCVLLCSNCHAEVEGGVARVG